MPLNPPCLLDLQGTVDLRTPRLLDLLLRLYLQTIQLPIQTISFPQQTIQLESQTISFLSKTVERVVSVRFTSPRQALRSGL